MKIKLFLVAAVAATLAIGAAAARPAPQDPVGPKIAWYSTLKSGLAEAARSDRPILFISAAPQCLGVPGTW